MDETSHIAKVFVKPKKGSGGRQLQEMMHQEGQKVSYRQAFEFIRKSNNLGHERYIEEVRKLKSFLTKMKETPIWGLLRNFLFNFTPYY